VSATERWTLIVLEENELDTLPFVESIREQKKGTLVLWRKLDRLAAAEGSIERGLGEGMVRVHDHLALVFHRYMSEGAAPDRLQISINESPVRPIDPFLTWHTATQLMPEERLQIERSVVAVQPYILPHYSKLAPPELEVAGGEEGLRREQGFYVYRNRRLIIWGTWFRLARQEELTKLARVRVDIPNSLDHLWTLDIKKSGAHPPLEVRQNLRRILERIAASSRRVYTYRGRRTNDEQSVPVWFRLEDRGGVAYRLNREHPVVASVSSRLDEPDQRLLESVLKSVEDMLPAEALYADMASDKCLVRQKSAVTIEELSDLALQLLDACGTDEGQRQTLLKNLPLLEPFVFHEEITQQIISRVRNGR
jgi:hypothetical protein